MQPEEKRKILLDTLDKATQIVKNYKKPYSDEVWTKFINRVNGILVEIEDEELRKIVFNLLSNTADYVNNNLNDE